MTPYRLKNIYFLASFVLIIGLSCIRSFPVYGKLDFILLDGRPWWKPWRPMIEQVVRQGDQPIVSDFITSSVFRGVFAQKAVAFRFDLAFARIDVDKLLAMNVEQRSLLPVGGILLLLKDEPDVSFDMSQRPGDTSIRKLMQDMAAVTSEKNQRDERQYPYRCLINLRGFALSWVPEETRHWSWKWTEPSLIYQYRGKRGKDMELLLRNNPPENCTVYF